MPQFDIHSFPSQIAWLFISLMILMGISVGWLLPRFAAKLAYRQHFLDHYRQEIDLLTEQYHHLVQSYKTSILQIQNESARYLQKVLTEFEEQKMQELTKLETQLQGELNSVQFQVSQKLMQIERRLMRDTTLYAQWITRSDQSVLS